MYTVSRLPVCLSRFVHLSLYLYLGPQIGHISSSHIQLLYSQMCLLCVSMGPIFSTFTVMLKRERMPTWMGTCATLHNLPFRPTNNRQTVHFVSHTHRLTHTHTSPSTHTIRTLNLLKPLTNLFLQQILMATQFRPLNRPCILSPGDWNMIIGFITWFIHITQIMSHMISGGHVIMTYNILWIIVMLRQHRQALDTNMDAWFTR